MINKKTSQPSLTSFLVAMTLIAPIPMSALLIIQFSKEYHSKTKILILSVLKKKELGMEFLRAVKLSFSAYGSCVGECEEATVQLLSFLLQGS